MSGIIALDSIPQHGEEFTPVKIIEEDGCPGISSGYHIKQRSRELKAPIVKLMLLPNKLQLFETPDSHQLIGKRRIRIRSCSKTTILPSANASFC